MPDELTLKEQAALAEGQELAERIMEEIASRPEDHELVVAEKAYADATAPEEAPEPPPEG